MPFVGRHFVADTLRKLGLGLLCVRLLLVSSTVFLGNPLDYLGRRNLFDSAFSFFFFLLKDSLSALMIREETIYKSRGAAQAASSDFA
jgi:hypothetical protein